MKIQIPVKLSVKTFVEIINENGKNYIVGCIYKHHTISPKDFTELMATLLSKISKEKKPCYLAGDFNMNLFQLDTKSDIGHYFDVITEKNFTPLITSPTRITSSTKTLIDNILYNEFSNNIISGNLLVGISDHIPQFALIPTNLSKTSKNNAKPAIKYARKYKRINTDIFNQDLDKIDWNPGRLDANQYGENFMNVFNQILDVHAPLTKIKHSKKNATKYKTVDY